MDNLQKQTVLNVAARILRNEILKYDYRDASYPPASTSLDNVVSSIPPLLTFFLGNLLCKNTTQEYSENFIIRDTIAHSIVKYLRPKQFISSLQLAVGSYIHRKTGSRLIIDFLNRLGVCASYYQIQLHESDAKNQLHESDAKNQLHGLVFFGCKTNCLSARSGCKKSGLKCNQFCENCQSCGNASRTSFILEEDENEHKDDDDGDGEGENTTDNGEHEENEAFIMNVRRSIVKNTHSEVSTRKIFCGCKSNCTSARCSCKKTDLQCNESCKFCHGQTCDNHLREEAPAKNVEEAAERLAVRSGSSINVID
ncbi:uncharacterized protein LOC135166046 isoform X2 [Diachasmimorpha longicaudata]